jgi:tetratricopeptide (TPR) repeat protein
MLNASVPEDQVTLLVTREPIQLVLTEGGRAGLSIALNDDLAEMISLKGKGFSINDFAESNLERRRELFSTELSNLAKKSEKFGASATFLNRMANLAQAAGRLDVEAEYLDRVIAISHSSYFSHKKAVNLIDQNKHAQAEQLFLRLDLKDDVEANLRIAYFHIQRKEHEQAAQRVADAVNINPLDFGARLFEGAIRLVERKYEQAIHSFRLANEERPTSSALHTNLAIAYLGLGKSEKALAALRKSVALNPLNSNAVILLSDVAHKEVCDADAIPSLRYYVQFEQKNPAIWSRLARGLLQIGCINESIGALKRQGSLEQTSSLWNNLGVAYHRNGDFKRSLDSFERAMELEHQILGRDFFLAARNAALILEQKKSPQDLLKFTELVVGVDTVRTSLTDRVLSDLVALRIHALFQVGDSASAIQASENVLKSEEVNLQLSLWAAITLLSWYPLNQRMDRALEISKEFSNKLDAIPATDNALKGRLINNIAFTYAEDGNTVEAEKYLSLITNQIHKEPYPTATLGLVHMRKGHLDRAVSLYEEAIRLAVTVNDKARIRQKLNVELGKSLISSDPGRARRYLTKAVATKSGEQGLLTQAEGLLKSLPFK